MTNATERTALSAPKAAGRQVGRTRYGILGMLFAVTVINYADRATMSIAGDDIQHKLGIQSTELGMIFSAFGWSYLFAQIPGGWLLDRFGAKRVYAWAIFLWSLFTGLQGFAENVSVISPIALFFILRLMVGVAEAPSFPGNSKIVAAWFPAQERGTAAAIFNSAQYFATVIFAPIMGWLVFSFGWEHVFFVAAIFGFILGGLWLVVIYSPLDHPRVKQSEIDYIRAGGALVSLDHRDAEQEKVSLRVTFARLRYLLSQRMTLGVYFGQYFINAITWFFLTWFPVYLVSARGMSILQAGFVASLPAICGFIGGVLGGVLSDSLLRRGVSLTLARKSTIVVGLLLSTTIIACNYVESSWLVVAFMALSFFGKGLGALGWAVMSDISPSEISGLSGSIFNSFGAVAAITTPLVVGIIVDRTGSFELALAFISLNAVLAIVCYVFIVGPIRRIVLPEHLKTHADA